MIFKPVGRSGSLVDTVVEQVQHLIADGHLESGDRLWRRLGRETHETAAALDPVWRALHRADQSWAW